LLGAIAFGALETVIQKISGNSILKDKEWHREVFHNTLLVSPLVGILGGSGAMWRNRLGKKNEDISRLEQEIAKRDAKLDKIHNCRNSHRPTFHL